MASQRRIGAGAATNSRAGAPLRNDRGSLMASGSRVTAADAVGRFLRPRLAGGAEPVRPAALRPLVPTAAWPEGRQGRRICPTIPGCGDWCPAQRAVGDAHGELATGILRGGAGRLSSPLRLRDGERLAPV